MTFSGFKLWGLVKQSFLKKGFVLPIKPTFTPRWAFTLQLEPRFQELDFNPSGLNLSFGIAIPISGEFQHPVAHYKSLDIIVYMKKIILLLISVICFFQLNSFAMLPLEGNVLDHHGPTLSYASNVTFNYPNVNLIEFTDNYIVFSSTIPIHVEGCSFIDRNEQIYKYKCPVGIRDFKSDASKGKSLYVESRELPRSYDGEKETLYFCTERIDNDNRRQFWLDYARAELSSFKEYKEKYQAAQVKGKALQGYIEPNKFREENLEDFLISLEYKNCQTWVAFVSTKPIQGIEDIDLSQVEMHVARLTLQGLPFQMHMGIFRSLRYMINGLNQKIPALFIHGKISLFLHGFIAKNSLLHDPSKVLMITSPLEAMGQMMDNALGEKVYKKTTRELLIHEHYATSDYQDLNSNRMQDGAFKSIYEREFFVKTPLEVLEKITIYSFYFSFNLAKELIGSSYSKNIVEILREDASIETTQKFLAYIKTVLLENEYLPKILGSFYEPFQKGEPLLPRYGFEFFKESLENCRSNASTTEEAMDIFIEAYIRFFAKDFIEVWNHDIAAKITISNEKFVKTHFERALRKSPIHIITGEKSSGSYCGTRDVNTEFHFWDIRDKDTVKPLISFNKAAKEAFIYPSGIALKGEAFKVLQWFFHRSNPLGEEMRGMHLIDLAQLFDPEFSLEQCPYRVRPIYGAALHPDEALFLLGQSTVAQ